MLQPDHPCLARAATRARGWQRPIQQPGHRTSGKSGRGHGDHVGAPAAARLGLRTRQLNFLSLPTQIKAVCLHQGQESHPLGQDNPGMGGPRCPGPQEVLACSFEAAPSARW